MSIELTCGQLRLNRHGIALLRNARGTRVASRHGVAWLTIDGVRDDVVLNPGDAFWIDTDCEVIVSAIAGPVEVAVQAGPTAPSAAPARRLWASLRSLFGGPHPVAV